MLTRETLAQQAAIRFRRIYLETISTGEIDTKTAWSLTLQLTRAIWLSKEAVALVLIISSLLLLTMPLGSYQLALFERTGYFSLVILAAVIGCVVLWLPISFLRIRGILNGGFSLFLTISVGVLCYSMCFIGIREVFSVELQFTPMEITVRSGLVATSAILLYFSVSPYTPQRLMQKQTPTSELSRQISKSKQGRLISISAQDHYVSVITSKGAELLLMTISDAISKVTVGLGIQIHRSHWVAISAIKRVDNQKRTVELTDGNVFPISPKRLSALTLELSRKDILLQQDRLFERKGSEIGLLGRLFRQNAQCRDILDHLFLEIFQGKELTNKRRLKIAIQIQKYSTTSSVFIITQTVHFIGLSTMQPFGLDQTDWYQPILFWTAVYVLMSMTIIPSHIVIWYLDLKFWSKAWGGIFIAIIYESFLALLIVPNLANFAFGPVFVSSQVFIVSTVLMLLIIIPNLYLGVRKHQSFHAWKRALNIPPIILKLPYETRGDIVFISADKRSVHVQTTGGKGIVKKKFNEALKLLDESKGIQVHRSHWVANAYIKGRRVDGASNFVELTTGDLIPLSAANIDNVDEYLHRNR